MKRFASLLVLFFLFITSVCAKTTQNEDIFQEEFKNWLQNFKKIANEEEGIDNKLLEDAFDGVEYKHKVIKLDRNQAEFVKTFWDYYSSAVHPLRIKRGQAKIKKYKTFLNKVEKRYGVPKNIIVALWGMETDYGRNMGKSKVMHVLATLAFDNRRSEFFTKQLIAALKIVQSKKIDLESMKGSWAGAFGNFQFIPTTYQAYAVDCDNDNKVDIRNSIPDALCSAANYLSKNGWNSSYRWGRPVKVNKNDKKIWKEAALRKWRPLSYFSKLGIKRVSGYRLPKANIKARLIAPMGKNGPVFLIYKNFRCIMQWNNSTNYALSVGLLSDAITNNKIGKLDYKH